MNIVLFVYLCEFPPTHRCAVFPRPSQKLFAEVICCWLCLLKCLVQGTACVGILRLARFLQRRTTLWSNRNRFTTPSALFPRTKSTTTTSSGYDYFISVGTIAMNTCLFLIVSIASYVQTKYVYLSKNSCHQSSFY